MRARPSRTSRPSLSGEQLVQEYLTRVAAAARHLPKGARMAFVGRTKAQIERQCGAAGMNDPGQVLEALTALGDPEDLVREERMRIDSKWLSKRARDDTAGTPTHPSARTPRVYRPLNSRWRPAAPHFRPPDRPGSGPAPVDDPLLTGQIVPAAEDTTGSAGFTGPAPADMPAASGPSISGPPASGPGGDTGPVPPAPWPGDLGSMLPPAPDSGAGSYAPQGGAQTPLDGIWQLARDHLRESIAVVLMGLGGAILPFPFWLLGVLTALFSRLWDGKDKTMAVAGPVLVVLLGSLLSALFTVTRNQNVILIYTHAVGANFGLWVRLGCVLTAVYLGWRVSRGPRVKIPPWKR